MNRKVKFISLTTNIDGENCDVLSADKCTFEQLSAVLTLAPAGAQLVIDVCEEDVSASPHM